MIANLHLESDMQGKVIGAKVIIGTMEFPLELGPQPVNVLADLLKPKIDAIVEERCRAMAKLAPDTAALQAIQEVTDAATACKWDGVPAEETVDKIADILLDYKFWPIAVA